MLSFASLERSIGSVPGSAVMRLRRIDTGRGREELYRNQLPTLLTELAHRARVDSITASSALEGVVVPDRVRAAQIIEGKVPVLRNRSEQEFAGYRAALDYLMTQTWQPLNIGLLLHLHGLLLQDTKGHGGAFKSSDNLVVDRSGDGSIEVRFVPVAASRTEFFTAELVSRFNVAVASGAHHPVLLIGLFALDLLTIHPFDDGNGRVARALTNALLADADYGVGRFVSLEQIIANSADDYYDSLLASTHGWHEESNDPWPWLSYFLGTVATAYDTFEVRAVSDHSSGTKQERVRQFVLNEAGAHFRIADIRAALPGISDQTIRLAMDSMKAEQLITPECLGRRATWGVRPKD